MPLPARPAPDIPPGFLGAATARPQSLPRPLLAHRVTAGFPSPAEDFYAPTDDLDLSAKCISNPLATYFCEVDSSTSMVEFGIFPGDLLVVDKSVQARPMDIVIALWEGGYLVKQLRKRAGRYELHSGSPEHRPIIVPPDVELEIWGVVTWSFRKQLRR